MAGQNIGHGCYARHSGALFLLIALCPVYRLHRSVSAGLFIWASSVIDAYQSAKSPRVRATSERAAHARMFRL